MQVLAASLARIAAARETVAEAAGLGQRLRQIGGAVARRLDADAAADPAGAAQQRLAAALDAEVRDSTTRLIELHGLEGHAQGEILERVAGQFARHERVPEGRAAILGGAVTGALAGLKADIASGGLTLGGGLHRRRPDRRPGRGRAGARHQRGARHRPQLGGVERRRDGPAGRSGAAALPGGGALRPRPRRMGAGRGAAALGGDRGRGAGRRSARRWPRCGPAAATASRTPAKPNAWPPRCSRCWPRAASALLARLYPGSHNPPP